MEENMHKQNRKQTLKIGIFFLALVALVVGIALPVYAANPSAPASFQMLQGKVQSVDAPEFVVLTAKQEQVTVVTNDNTTYFIIPMGKAQAEVNTVNPRDNKQDKEPGKPQFSIAKNLNNAHIPANWRDNLGWLANFDKPASFKDIAVEDRVIVRVDSAKLAKQVLIIKAPVNRTVKGSIEVTGSDRITITPTDGSDAVILNVVDATRIILNGQTAITGYAVALYNSTNNNALVVNVRATDPQSVTLKSIAITPKLPEDLEKGATQQFAAEATYSDGTTKNVTSKVTWTSSDTGVATITAHGGLARGKAEGTSDITAKLNGVESNTVILTVVP
jgi:hypothetical protein